MLRKLSLIAIAFLALPFSGCWEFELFSWSPDGRYLVIVDPNENEAWRWDTVKQRPEPIPGLKGTEVTRFHFTSNREAIVMGTRFKTSSIMGPDADGLVKLNLMDGYFHEVPPGAEAQWFAVSPDGSRIATVHAASSEEEGEEGGERYVVAIAPSNDVNKRRIVGEFKEELLTPAFDRTGTRLLLTKAVAEDQLPEGVEEGAEILLLEFDTDTTQVRSFVRSFGEYPINPRWIGDDAFTYLRLREDEEEEDGISALMLMAIDGGEPEQIYDHTFYYFPPSVSPDGTTIVFSAALNHEMSLDEVMQSSVQLMAHNLESQEQAVLTDEPFGAYAGEFHPTKNQVAYATGDGPMSVRILDIDTGHRQIVWRNEEEQLFAAGERLAETGDIGMALANFDELLHRFPESGFRSRTFYRKMNIHLDSTLNEFDQAVSAFEELSYGDLRPQARALLWQQPDAEASDPSGDLLRRYKTQASEAEFQHDTDRTRDLTSLAAKWTPKRLYLKIGFDSSYDLGGSVFQDLVFLFHDAKNSDGTRKATPSVDWEHPAKRTVIVRHWHKAGKVYDLDVLNEAGEPIAKFAVSGIDTPSFPLFDIFDQSHDPNDEGGSIMCWLDLDAIGLETNRDYELQVCTVKGGIESYKGVERPREESGWDIADAFGDVNTKARIDAEIEAGAKPVLQGYAATIRIPRESDAN
jgi:hypothetical protein